MCLAIIRTHQEGCNYEDNALSGAAHVWAMNVISKHVGALHEYQ